MRGIAIWAIAALMSVVGLQPAALASTLSLRDIGMGQSMKERLIAAPSTLSNISTIPAGLVFGPVGKSAKDGGLVYKVLLGPAGFTVVNAVIAGKSASLRVGDYPLAWAPKSAVVPALPRVAAASGERMVMSGGSQPSGNPSYGNHGVWCCEFSLEHKQDLTGWNPLTQKLGGSVTAGHADLKLGIRVADSLSIFMGPRATWTRDDSWSWRDNTASNSVTFGPLVGLKWQADPSNQLEAGLSYGLVLAGDPSPAKNPVSWYAGWRGDHGRWWYHKAKLAGSLPAGGNGARFELGLRPLEKLNALNLHVVGQGRQLWPEDGKFDPAKHLVGQLGGGFGFDVTDQVTANVDLFAPGKPGDSVAVGGGVDVHF